MLKLKKAIKRTRVIMLALIFMISAVFIPGARADAYGSKTHPWLTTRGITLIKNANPTISKLLSVTINRQKASSILINNANVPDTLSSELYPNDQKPSLSNYAAPHFYDPRTGFNYAGSLDTANSRLQNHYNNAVSLYKSGKKAEAYKELGMALHFLEDLCTPHHAVNATALNSNHTAYENWIDSNAANKTSYNETAIDNATYTLVNMNGIFYIGNQMASESVNSAQYVVASAETAAVKANYPATANMDLKRAQRIAAGVIYKFYFDVGAVK